MNQIYNLLQTIEDDKAQVAKLKRQLHNAESILEAHTQALTRLTTIPKLLQPKVEKSSLSPMQRVTGKIRVTMDNILDLGIEVGDTIEIVKSGDDDFCNNTMSKVVEIDIKEKEVPFFLSRGEEGSDTWYSFCYDYEYFPEDHELYLIKSQENK